MEKPTMIVWEKQYDDRSGVQYGVRLVDGEIILVADSQNFTFPNDQLDWFIDRIDDATKLLQEKAQ